MDTFSQYKTQQYQAKLEPCAYFYGYIVHDPVGREPTVWTPLVVCFSIDQPSADDVRATWGQLLDFQL